VAQRFDSVEDYAAYLAQQRAREEREANRADDACSERGLEPDQDD
jgi:hypothetical protein